MRKASSNDHQVALMHSMLVYTMVKVAAYLYQFQHSMAVESEEFMAGIIEQLFTMNLIESLPPFLVSLILKISQSFLSVQTINMLSTDATVLNAARDRWRIMHPNDPSDLTQSISVWQEQLPTIGRFQGGLREEDDFPLIFQQLTSPFFSFGLFHPLIERPKLSQYNDVRFTRLLHKVTKWITHKHVGILPGVIGYRIRDYAGLELANSIFLARILAYNLIFTNSLGIYLDESEIRALYFPDLGIKDQSMNSKRLIAEEFEKIGLRSWVPLKLLIMDSRMIGSSWLYFCFHLLYRIVLFILKLVSPR